MAESGRASGLSSPDLTTIVSTALHTGSQDAPARIASMRLVGLVHFQGSGQFFLANAEVTDNHGR